MKILVTGCCGFVGYQIIKHLTETLDTSSFFGLDNLSRKGAEINLKKLRELRVKFYHGDVRLGSDLAELPNVDFVIDCCANPSVLAGLNGKASSRQLMEHNLFGTLNLLEFCKTNNAGLILMSTSRVYSAESLAKLPMVREENKFSLDNKYSELGISNKGISEEFPTTPPLSLYGTSKMASEALVLEYAHSFNFPVWINRCGVLAGAGQFGKADQGIFSYWIHSFREKKPLKYIGFNGTGYQVRDALHPKDLVPILIRQIQEPDIEIPKTLNFGGGLENSMSLLELSLWCEKRFDSIPVVQSKEERPMDAPWIVMDSSVAYKYWGWKPTTKIESILEEIASHAERNSDWLINST